MHGSDYYYTFIYISGSLNYRPKKQAYLYSTVMYLATSIHQLSL